MSPDQFERCVKVAAPFLTHSAPDEGLIANRGIKARRRKILGVFGGEPLMHPKFPELVDIMCKHIPQTYRGLWTSFDWVNGESKVWGSFKAQVIRLLGTPSGNVHDTQSGNGYINWNMHEETQPCNHQPVLVASQDVVKNKVERWKLINKCWVQQEWSAAYALDYNNEPKFYFCEVASSFDRVFNLGTCLDVESGVWSHHLWFEEDSEGVLVPKGPYAKQILSTCNRCGAALKLPGRRDREFADDISPSNLVQLQVLGSPMVKKEQYHTITADNYKPRTEKHEPWEYLQDGRKQQKQNFEQACKSLKETTETTENVGEY